MASPASGQVQEFKLDGSDRWTETKEIDPVSDEGQIMAMRQALEAKDHGRAKNLADRFIEARPLSPLRAEALLVRADATYGLDDEYNALYDYEEVCRRYAGSEVFVTALEREFEIAVAYAKGKKRKFFGTFRLLSAYEDAQELLIRIQERLPGSELAEKAGLALTDFYFDNRELTLAAEAYDLFLENYPKSKHVTKAQLRLIYSYIAAFKGPLYDLTGLIEANTRLPSLHGTDRSRAHQPWACQPPVALGGGGGVFSGVFRGHAHEVRHPGPQGQIVRGSVPATSALGGSPARRSRSPPASCR